MGITSAAPTDPEAQYHQNIAAMERRIAELERAGARDIGGLSMFSSRYVALVAEATYVPNLTSTATQPNLGTTPTKTGFYTVEGGVCTWSAQITMAGTGQAAGTGNYNISLPVTPKHNSTYEIVGHGWVFVSGVFYTVELDASTGVQVARMILNNGVFGATVPAGGLAANSIVSVCGSYRVAP